MSKNFLQKNDRTFAIKMVVKFTLGVRLKVELAVKPEIRDRVPANLWYIIGFQNDLLHISVPDSDELVEESLGEASGEPAGEVTRDDAGPLAAAPN